MKKITIKDIEQIVANKSLFKKYTLSNYRITKVLRGLAMFFVTVTLGVLLMSLIYKDYRDGTLSYTETIHYFYGDLLIIVTLVFVAVYLAYILNQHIKSERNYRLFASEGEIVEATETKIYYTKTSKDLTNGPKVHLNTKYKYALCVFTTNNASVDELVRDLIAMLKEKDFSKVMHTMKRGKVYQPSLLDKRLSTYDESFKVGIIVYEKGELQPDSEYEVQFETSYIPYSLLLRDNLIVIDTFRYFNEQY